MSIFETKILGIEGRFIPDEGESLIHKELEKARQEWEEAKNFFDNVLEQDLIDFAIYKMEAAERKYMHLLNLAKKEGIENKILGGSIRK